MWQLLLLMIALGGLGSARAQEAAIPVLDIAAVPNLDARGRAGYADFLLMNLPRAFALASNGQSGWRAGGASIETVRARALKICTDAGGIDCSLYAEDLQVVWHNRAPIALPQPPARLFGDSDFALLPDPRFFWHGPARATGVLVWAHGKSGGGQDLRNEQPQPFVRAFNNAGYDVVRYDRAPGADYAEAAAGFLRHGLVWLRQSGWRAVVMAGQSRGAWNSLQMLDEPGLVDAVIAISPANFASQATQEAELDRILRNARSPAARAVVVEFRGDAYVPDMPRRIAELHDLAPPNVAAVLVIDEPDGINGHGGGSTNDFSRRYGRCLLRFVTAPSPPARCP